MPSQQQNLVKAIKVIANPNDQLSFFDESVKNPLGFQYADDVISHQQEKDIIDIFPSLPFKEFEFQGFQGKRRTVSYGWKYDFNLFKLVPTDKIPEFLYPILNQAAQFSGISPQRLEQVLITEYSPGAGIGWHKDRPVFEDVVGISLLSPCKFRFRQENGKVWKRHAVTAMPRSAYLLSGISRWEWEHSIASVSELRYSITFRSLKFP